MHNIFQNLFFIYENISYVTNFIQQILTFRYPWLGNLYLQEYSVAHLSNVANCLVVTQGNNT